jgi:hypothetical protein
MQILIARMFGSSPLARLLIVSLLPTAAAAESPKVTITGGKQTGETYYRWEVTNWYASPIVRIEFPQYGVDGFHIPPMWKQGTVKEMNLVNVGWDYRNPGVCFAEADPPYAGLPRGAAAEFSMRNAPRARNVPSKGTVHVVFADGTTYDVADVELPTKVDEGSPLGMLLGVAALFVICVIILEVRKRRAARSSDDDQVTQQP